MQTTLTRFYVGVAASRSSGRIRTVAAGMCNRQAGSAMAFKQARSISTSSLRCTSSSPPPLSSSRRVDGHLHGAAAADHHSTASEDGPGHLVVVGGNGHLGSAICKAAVERGIAVKSISRRGTAPIHQSSSSSSTGNRRGVRETAGGSWLSEVEWIKADAMDPDSYRHVLKGAAGVVHTVGTLMENDWYAISSLSPTILRWPKLADTAGHRLPARSCPPRRRCPAASARFSTVQRGSARFLASECSC